MRHSTLVLCALGAALLCSPLAKAQFADDLQSPVQLQAGGTPVDVEREGHAAPWAGDFDGDGVRDLLVGQFDDGRLRVYLNRGSDTSPLFESFVWAQAGGAMLRVPTNCCVGLTPQLVDLDGDGRVDLLSGSFPGEVYFFRREADGTFADGRQLCDTAGKPLKLGHAVTSFAADWDADGTFDLLTGNIQGEVFVLRGNGNRLAFAEPVRMSEAGKPISMAGGDSAPVAADWDLDGKLDLVVGAGNGGVVFYRRTGLPQESQLEGGRILVGESPAGWRDDSSWRPGQWGLRVKPCVVDWNGDGKLDLLIGDLCGGFQARPTQTGEEVAEERASSDRLPGLRKAWSTLFAEYQREAATGEGDRVNQLRERLRQLKDEIAHDQQTRVRYQTDFQRHGFVWLFLRK